MDHDQRFKLLIQMFLAELFQAFFSVWFERFDFNRATWLEQEVFLDPPQGERRVLDLVAQLPVRLRPGEKAGDEELALIHIEVEAEETSLAVRRRLYDSYVQLRRKYNRRVLPIAIFLRVGLDGIGIGRDEEKFDDLEVLTFQFHYVGLPGLDAQTYLNSPNSLAVALSALMRAPRDQRGELAAEALRRIEASSENPARKHLLAECIKAYAPLDEQQWHEFDQLLLNERYQGVRAMGKTWTEIGEERGLEKGQREILWKLIDARFGPLGPETRRRFDALPRERLGDVGVALLNAQSLRELGLQD